MQRESAPPNRGESTHVLMRRRVVRALRLRLARDAVEEVNEAEAALAEEHLSKKGSVGSAHPLELVGRARLHDSHSLQVEGFAGRRYVAVADPLTSTTSLTLDWPRPPFIRVSKYGSSAIVSIWNTVRGSAASW